MRASVIVPAHNEAAVIERCLGSILEDASPGEFDIIVACNGCTDDTAARARAIDGVTVLDIPAASKPAALTEADRYARGGVRCYVDADVEVSAGALREVIEALNDGAWVAAPRAAFDLTACSILVRSWYRIWLSLPFMEEHPVGCGFYALSPHARTLFQSFPDTYAEDLFIYALASPPRRVRLDTCTFTVRPPRRVSDLLGVRTRVHAANRSTAGLAGERHRITERQRRALLGAVTSPRRWLPLGVYLAVEAVARTGARWQLRRVAALQWTRDESTRRMP